VLGAERERRIGCRGWWPGCLPLVGEQFGDTGLGVGSDEGGDTRCVGNAVPGKWGDCALKSEQCPTDLAPATSSRQVFVNESAGAVRSSGRATAHLENMLIGYFAGLCLGNYDEWVPPRIRPDKRPSRQQSCKFPQKGVLRYLDLCSHSFGRITPLPRKCLAHAPIRWPPLMGHHPHLFTESLANYPP
jgi:hypothetical protein